MTTPTPSEALGELSDALLSATSWPVYVAPQGPAQTPAVLLDPADPFADPTSIDGGRDTGFRITVAVAGIDQTGVLFDALDALRLVVGVIHALDGWSVGSVGPIGPLIIAEQTYYGAQATARTLTDWRV